MCVPVDKYCDMTYDCPQGTDEITCSCEDWNMQSCVIGQAQLCIYNEWITASNTNTTENTTTCIEALGINSEVRQDKGDEVQCMVFRNRTTVDSLVGEGSSHASGCQTY